MYKASLILVSALLLSACGSDNREVESSLQEATEHAQAAAKHLSKAVSESSRELRDQWAESNAGRHGDIPNEETSAPTQDANMAAIKEKYEELKQVAAEKGEAGMKVAKEKYEEAKRIALEKTEAVMEKSKEWSK